MTLDDKKKIYDLEERALRFAKNVVSLCRNFEKSVVDSQIIRQLVRSATSIGANYQEANDALSKRDFVYRIRISRKEAKETSYWLQLLMDGNRDFESEILALHSESIELKKILSAIALKSC